MQEGVIDDVMGRS